MGIGRSVTYTLLDSSYLLSRDLPAVTKLRVFGVYLRLTSQFFLYKLLRMNPTSARALGLRFSFPDFPTFAFLFREIFVKREYGFAMKKNPVIVDCGANIGMATLFFKHSYPGATVHAFEPVPEYFTHLRENVSRNGLRKVHLYEAAVGAREGSVEFYFDAAKPLMASMKKEHGGAVAVRVKMMRLSRFILKVKPDVLKVDIEGAESEVFADLDRTGALKVVKFAMIEYHHNTGQGSLAAFLEILERNGFVYYLDAALSPRSRNEDVMIYALRE